MLQKQKQASETGDKLNTESVESNESHSVSATADADECDDLVKVQDEHISTDKSAFGNDGEENVNDVGERCLSCTNDLSVNLCQEHNSEANEDSRLSYNSVVCEETESSVQQANSDMDQSTVAQSDSGLRSAAAAASADDAGTETAPGISL